MASEEEILLLNKLKEVRLKLKIATQGLEKIVRGNKSTAQEIANKTLNEIMGDFKNEIN